MFNFQPPKNMHRHLFALSLLASLACTTGEKKTAEATTATDSVIVSTVANETLNEAAPDDGEIQEFGLLKEAEDAGYPFAVLTIEFPERKFSESFTLNLEEVKGVDLNKIREWTGQYVSFRYTSEQENALLDVQQDGKSIVDPSGAIDVSKAKKIEGTLKGATQETPGDLPGTVSIVTPDGEHKFSFFVTKEMVDANGKAVVGFYDERTKNTIKSIKKK
jgi:hypothetical protein